MPQFTKGWYWLGLTVFVAGLVAYANHHDLRGLIAGYRHSETQVDALEATLEGLKADELALKRDVEHLSGDELTQESAIRKSKGLVREGETIYRVELPNESTQ